MFKGRIKKGMALLDRKRPGWDERIDLTKLNLKDTCNCVLGQEYKEDSTTLAAYYGDGFDLGLTKLELRGIDANYGFDIDDDKAEKESIDTYYERLTEEWREAISLRRMEKPFHLDVWISPLQERKR